MVGGTPLLGADIASIIEKNPIRSFEAWELKGADHAVRALKNSSTLRNVSLERSDLTDEGLRLIPLEQLTQLRIEHSKITPVGLRELRRCRQLKLLGVDGTQAPSAIAELLAIEPKLAGLSLWLEGGAPQQVGVLSLDNGAIAFNGDDTTRAMLDKPLYDRENDRHVMLDDNPARYMELLPGKFAGSYFWAEMQEDKG